MSAVVASAGHMRRRVFEFILILLAALAAALVVRYLSDRGEISGGYVPPINAVIVLVGGYLAIRAVTRVIGRVAEPAFGMTRTRGLENVFQVLAWIVVFVFVFAVFGFNLTAALIGAGFLGIVLGLAAQQVLGNIFAGLSMLASKPFEIGDRVKLATSSYGLTGSTYSHESETSGFTGVVQDVGIFFTRVQLDNGIPAVFPNSVVIGALILNYSRITLRTVRVRMDLDRKTDFDRFREGLLGSLKKHDEIDGQRSSVEIVGLGATTYEVVIEVWTKSEVDEPIRTLVIREGMKLQGDVSGA